MLFAQRVTIVYDINHHIYWTQFELEEYSYIITFHTYVKTIQIKAEQYHIYRGPNLANQKKTGVGRKPLPTFFVMLVNITKMEQ